MQKLAIYIETIFKLGIWNVVYVLWYRVSIKTGIRKLWFPIKNIECSQDYFFPYDTSIISDFPQEWKKPIIEEADKIITGHVKYYNYHWKEVGSPPNWFLNPFNGKEYLNANQHWTTLPDFCEEVGDIKNIWEVSRFLWIIVLARAYSISGDAKYLNTLNEWLKDWSNNNPFNVGPNWKCGQETGIRLINLVIVSLILNQENNPSKALSDIIYGHLERISANILYSIAQDNNHGTSEAAALFIGGAFLEQTDHEGYHKAKVFSNKGRKWLENRVAKLIEEDGSFSQHSVNYHRLMLDTLSFCEYWRIKFNKKEFSNQFYEKSKAATNWLFYLTDYSSGNAVNLGANDGALLNSLNSSDYRDFRPSIHLASALFLNTKFFNNGIWNESLYWLNIKVNESGIILKPQSKLFKSGYVRIVADQTWCLIRFPYFKFRPSHNDVFHFDLWYKGENILCDAGSYSYNPPIEDSRVDLKSVRHHNTISFDNNEQMPKLSRFLLGKWLQINTLGHIKANNTESVSWEGSYFANYKNKHQRKIIAEKNSWIIEDTIEGNFKDAVIGFNINTLEYVLDSNRLFCAFGEFILPKYSKASIVETYISEYYFHKRKISRLNIKVTKPGKYETTIIFN